MLITFRIPISDGRYFSNDTDVATSVVVPSSWGQGDFVRGLGEITKRPVPPVEPWKYESAFADLHRAIRFSPASLSQFNSTYPEFCVSKIRKRAWLPLAEIRSMLDLDISLQLNPKSQSHHLYPRNSQFQISKSSEIAQSLSLLPVTVNDHNGLKCTTNLLKSGPLIVERYSHQTSRKSYDLPTNLVKSGRTIAVLEAPGQLANDVGIYKNNTAKIANTRITSISVNSGSSSNFELYILWSETSSKSARKNIREIRIHLLRLQSIYSLLRTIASLSNSNNLSDEIGTDGFNALQRSLLSCIRFVHGRTRPGGESARKILNTVFRTTDFGAQLDELLPRTLSSMRPKVQKEIESFQELESLRLQQTGHQSATPPIYNLSGVFTMSNHNNFHLNGDNLGNFGANDRTSVNNNFFNGQLTIGSQTFSRNDLVADLVRVSESDPNDGKNFSQLDSAIELLNQKKDKKALETLRTIGPWISKTASAISAGTAVAAINSLLGIS